jgi:septum formation protein
MKPQKLSKQAPLLLGSQSARRREILEGLGIPIEVRPANTDENVGIEAPHPFLERVVADKLEAAEHLGEGAFPAILVADTIVVLDGEVLGKPRDVEHAAELVSRLAGKSHTVLTRYALKSAANVRFRTVESRVHMRAATTELVRRYAATGEGLDKAGAYAIQGIGSFLVRAIEGSYTNVVGLPACEVVEDLEAEGLLSGFPGS